MSLDLANKVEKFLVERAGEKFTAREIAEWVFKEFPSECQEKKENSKSIKTDAGLITQISAEISSRCQRLQERNPQIKITTENSHVHYSATKIHQNASSKMKKNEDGGENQNKADHAPEKGTLKENELYPLLSEYLYQGSANRVYSKRIDEKKSSNKQGPKGNIWLYPDLVGVEDITADWHQEVKHLAKEYSDKKTKLWSFEVKRHLNRTNVREAYFQAVSNSSWANLGYLVATGIQEGDTKKELRMLFSLHGIGVIQINLEKPVASQIFLPARERADVDWDTCSRLAKENRDFRQYMKLVRQFYQTGELRPQDWDFPGS